MADVATEITKRIKAGGNHTFYTDSGDGSVTGIPDRFDGMTLSLTDPVWASGQGVPYENPRRFVSIDELVGMSSLEELAV